MGHWDYPTAASAPRGIGSRPAPPYTSSNSRAPIGLAPAAASPSAASLASRAAESRALSSRRRASAADAADASAHTCKHTSTVIWVARGFVRAAGAVACAAGPGDDLSACCTHVRLELRSDLREDLQLLEARLPLRSLGGGAAVHFAAARAVNDIGVLDPLAEPV